MPQMEKVMKGQRGKALVIVLIIMVIGAMVMTALLPFVTASMTSAGRESLNTRTHYAADAAVQRIITHALLTPRDETPDGEWPGSYPLFDDKSLSDGVTLNYGGESYEATVDVTTTPESTSYNKEYWIVSKVGGFTVIECYINHGGNETHPKVDIISWEIK